MAADNIKKVIEIADCLMTFKMTDTIIKLLDGGIAQFLVKCKNAAKTLRNPNDVVPFTDHDTPEEHSEIQAIRSVANSVLESADEISNFVSRAKSAGFAPPDNPILEISRLNSGRRFKTSSVGGKLIIIPQTIDENLADNIMFNISVFLDLIEKEKSGELNLEERSSSSVGKSAQISSYGFSLAGFELALSDGQSDLLGFLPDIDKIKRQRIKQALGALDFRKREPQIIFTANYDPDGVSRGCIVGWKKISDASGYILRRHDIFGNVDIEYSLPNEAIISEYEAVREYVNEWVLSFYGNNITSDRIYAFLDKDIKPHNFYTYTLKAYQNVRTDKKFVFQTDLSPFIMSPLQIEDVRTEMYSYVKDTIGKRLTQAGSDDISPYPFLSKKFYGHDKYDWILAALNVNAAIERGDTRSEVRKFSYLGSQLSFVKEQISANKFYRPINPNEIINNIKESISTFGLSQTLIEIITATGLDLFFGPKESSAEDQFKRATAIIDETDLGEIGTILSSIDPETATVDMSILTSNLLDVLQGKKLSSDPDIASTPTEISVPNSSEIADDPLQFIGTFNPGQESLDLATFDGISEFVRTIRLFFDMSPNRALFGTVGEDDTQTEDQVTIQDGTKISSTEFFGPSGE